MRKVNIVERKKFKSLEIDVEKGIYKLNGENMEMISEINLDFDNGKWTLLVTREEIYEQATPEELLE